MTFADRRSAGRLLGRQLATQLEWLRGPDAVVLGLPRGGVPVAYEVARALEAPLDVIVVRKLGAPFQPELAMGAIGEHGARVLDEGMLSAGRISSAEVAAVERRERAVLEARVAALRRGRPMVDLRGRTAVVVDDGLATGSTARVACAVARELGASRVVLAVPVAAAAALHDFHDADLVVHLLAPKRFGAVSRHYEDFAATTDEEVAHLLDASRHPAGHPAAHPAIHPCAESAGPSTLTPRGG